MVGEDKNFTKISIGYLVINFYTRWNYFSTQKCTKIILWNYFSTQKCTKIMLNMKWYKIKYKVILGKLVDYFSTQKCIKIIILYLNKILEFQQCCTLLQEDFTAI